MGPVEFAEPGKIERIELIEIPEFAFVYREVIEQLIAAELDLSRVAVDQALGRRIRCGLDSL